MAVITVDPDVLILKGNLAIGQAKGINEYAVQLDRNIADTSRAWDSAEAVLYTAKIMKQNQRVKKLADTMDRFGQLLVRMGDEWKAEKENQKSAVNSLED